jgi:hypothetical protein
MTIWVSPKHDRFLWVLAALASPWQVIPSAEHPEIAMVVSLLGLYVARNCKKHPMNMCFFVSICGYLEDHPIVSGFT